MVVGQPGEHLGAQIVRHQPVVSRERDAHVLFATSAFQRECGEIQAGRPPFRSLDHLVELGGTELDLRSLQQGTRHGVIHGEIADTDLSDVTAGAQAGEGQWRLGASGDRET